MRAFAFILCCAVATGCVTSGTERRLAALEQELEQLHSPQYMRELEGASRGQMVASIGEWVPQVSKISLLGALAPTTVAGIGGVTLGTSQTITGAKTFSAGLILNGSTVAAELTQAAKLCFDSPTDAKCLSSDGSSLVTTVLGVNIAGFSFFNGAQFASNVIIQGTTQLGSSGNAISNSYSGSATIDFAATTNTTLDSSGVTVTNAAVGDVCLVGVPTAAAVTGASFTCYVSATSTVKVRLTAVGTSIDPASGTFNVRTFH